MLSCLGLDKIEGYQWKAIRRHPFLVSSTCLGVCIIYLVVRRRGEETKTQATVGIRQILSTKLEVGVERAVSVPVGTNEQWATGREPCTLPPNSWGSSSSTAVGE